MTISQAQNDLSRRKFMALAGSAAGLAAMAAMGIPAGRGECSVNIPEIDVDKMTTTDHHTDVLVVGGGIAGLFAAVKAYDAGAGVLMVSKGRLGASGQTPFARGIFAYDVATAKMSLDQFVESVSTSALGTNNPVFTRQMAANSLARVNELKAWGFFDSPLYANTFNKPMAERKIPILERVMMTHLIKENGRIAGAAGFSLDNTVVHFFTARSVILCTGAGGFKPSGFPICDLTHDGTMMAYDIGAKVTGKEWNDGHSANLNNPADVFGQWGGMLQGPPTVNSVEVHHDLGVDQNYEIYRKGVQFKASSGPPTSRETVAGGPFRPEGFENQGPPPRGGRDERGPGGPPPGGRKNAKGPEGAPPRADNRGKPPGRGGISSGGASAGMSIHKAEGLVPINDSGASNIPGLYAAGDALGSYMAGAIYTQVGSSLAGSAVQGCISGETSAAYATDLALPVIPEEKRKKVTAEILAPLKRERGYSPAWVTQTLQGIMIPNFVLYIKKERILRAALAYIEELRDHHQPMLRAADLHELRLAHETSNMILNAEMKLRASLMRTESRCSHYRLDYPDLDDTNWNAWINIHKGSDGTMTLEKQFFEDWPAVSDNT